MSSWLDKLTFPRILLIWVLIVLFFGLVYYKISDSNSYLFHITNDSSVNNILDAVYFSFVTATTTGFGDIIPLGSFKAVAVSEVVLGLLLLAIVTSKLVSIKQNVIISELYDISYQERLRRMRSSLVLFRQNLGYIFSRIEEGRFGRKAISDLEVYISSFEDVLNEVSVLLSTRHDYPFLKQLDSMNAELIFNSILASLEKLKELIDMMDKYKYEWKNEVIIALINRCLMLTEDLFNKLKSSNKLIENTIKDLDIQKKELCQQIKKRISAESDLKSFILPSN